MRYRLLLAGLALGSLLALHDARPLPAATFWYGGLGWLQPGIVALAGGDGTSPDAGFRLSRTAEAGSYAAQ